MSGDRDKLRNLLAVMLNTADAELTCEESGELAHAYVERRLAGLPLDEPNLLQVHQHMSVCAPCQEFIESLIQTLKAESGGD